MIELINSYLNDVEKFVSKLRSQIGNVNPMRAVRNGDLSKEGQIDSIEYSMHGKGFRLKIKDRLIDFDFGENLRYDGFDLWRLKSYAESQSQKYRSIQIESEFEKISSEGIIIKSSNSLDSNYYLRNKIPQYFIQ